MKISQYQLTHLKNLILADVPRVDTVKIHLDMSTILEKAYEAIIPAEIKLLLTDNIKKQYVIPKQVVSYGGAKVEGLIPGTHIGYRYHLSDADIVQHLGKDIANQVMKLNEILIKESSELQHLGRQIQAGFTGMSTTKRIEEYMPEFMAYIKKLYPAYAPSSRKYVEVVQFREIITTLRSYGWVGLPPITASQAPISTVQSPEIISA